MESSSGRKSVVSRILVADDLERPDHDQPGPVLRLGALLAEPLHAEIRLVHAYSMPELTIPPDELARIEGPFMDRMNRALDDETRVVKSERPQLRIVSALERGKTVETILHDIEAYDCGLVVLGTHARHGVRRAVLGSVAEEVIRRSTAPVVCLNPHAELERGFQVKNLLVALDLPEASKTVLDEAALLARALGARVELMTVVEEWVYPVVQSASLLAGGFVMPLERDLAELAAQRSTELTALAAPFVAEGLKVGTHVVEHAASISSGVCSRARDMSADLVLVGHRHASRLQYALLGSVSRHVIRDASCPVLVVPP